MGRLCLLKYYIIFGFKINDSAAEKTNYVWKQALFKEHSQNQAYSENTTVTIKRCPNFRDFI